MREYALVAVVAAAVTHLLVPLARALALRWGAVARPRDRDVHAVPTPRLGGIAIYGGTAAALLVAENLPALQRVAQSSSAPRAVLVAGAVICLLGALDDRYGLDALTKLAGQVLAAGVLVLLGIQVLLVLVPGQGVVSLSPDIAVPVTVLLVLLTVNAVNFVDGLDGLAAGMVGIAALAFFVFSYQLSVVQNVDRADSPTLIAAVTVGVCAGFLPHNLHPARVFMGDSGSMLLGLLLAAAAVSVTGQVSPGGTAGAQSVAPALFLPVLLPLAVLAVPLGDLLLAVVRRTRAGRSPFAPDKRHLHHRLLEIGHSQTGAVGVLCSLTALLAFGGVALALADARLVTAAVAAGLLLVALAVRARPRAPSSRAAGRLARADPGEGR
ncbi:MAG TPA: MraY family glycosyltransferase [Miltoncostaeaceae bacterium]|nr:MraY family glycosyltransferase [Miltoncostaeaceae bacterium]